MPSRFPHATVIRLEDNYRSTPEVLEFANRLVPRLGGAEKVLRATKAEGPEPITRSFSARSSKRPSSSSVSVSFTRQGSPYEEMAILFRTNARSADYEEALSEAGIPSQGAALLARDAAKQLLKALRGRPVSDVPKIAREQGLLEVDPGPARRARGDAPERPRAPRPARRRARRGSSAEFVAYLEEHFGSESGRGVHLLTYHRAKGLEFEAVFLPRLEERELPSKLSKTADALAEERRLLYVGLTRAKRHLTVTWSGKPSRFLAELQIEDERPRPKSVEPDDPLYEVLKRWRLETAKAGRAARVRDLPQHDAGRDRPACSAQPRGARRRARRRPGQARALRRRSVGRARR